MSNDKLSKMEKAKQDVRDAKYWQGLHGTIEGNSGKPAFFISKAYSEAPKLIRVGRRTDGHYYHETNRGFNDAILEYLVTDWDNIYPKVIEILEKKEAEALVELQEYVDSLQAEINSAKTKLGEV